MASITLRVGASLDSSVLSMYQPLEKVAARAAQNIAREAERAAKQRVAAETAANRQLERDLARLEKEKTREVANAAKERQRQEREATKASEREATARAKAAERAAKEEKRALDRGVAEARRALAERAREEKAALRQIEQDLVAHNRRKEQEARRALVEGRRAQAAQDRRQRSDDQSWDRIQAGVQRGVGRALSFGRRIVSDTIQGLGVETNLPALIRQGVNLEQAAVDLSNQGYQPGAKGAAGIRQDPGLLARQVREVATATAYDPMAAIGGLDKFVAKTGDLETGRNILEPLAKMAKATKTDLDDILDAAGDLSSQLGDIPNKGDAIVRVMQAFVGQGKLGAVEIKDLSVQMAGLAAMSNQFEGGAEANLPLMGVLAQEARQRGGAKSAAQAVTSVQSFANTFSKGARRKEFAALGINLDSATEPGKIRNPEEIILEALQKTGGKPDAMNKLFMDVRAQSAVRGFTTIYHEAGGGQAGLKAVSEEFDRLRKAAMGQGETMESFKRAMQTSESQAQVFNNQLATAADQIRIGLLPALTALAPMVVEAADAFGKWIGHVTGADEKNVHDAAETLGKEDAKRRIEGGESAEAPLLKNVNRKFVPGQGLVPVYRKEDIDTATQEVLRRKEIISKEQQRIDEEREKYKDVSPDDTSHLGDIARISRVQTAMDQAKVDALVQETSKQNATLLMILDAIGKRQATVDAPTPTPQPPGAGFGGVMPPGAR